MALAQQTDLLLLDEPTTFLDCRHQVEVLDLLTDLNRERGTTIVMVLHDLNLAARYADHLIALADGRLHAAGDPADVLTEETVRAVFGLDSQRHHRPDHRQAADAAHRAPPHVSPLIRPETPGVRPGRGRRGRAPGRPAR